MKIIKFILLFILAINSFAFDSVKSITINGKEILIPVDTGFYMVDDQLSEFEQVMKKMIPPGHIYVGGLIHEKDIVSLLEGEQPSYDSFIHLSTLDATKYKDSNSFNEKKFLSLIKLVKKSNQKDRKTITKDANSLFETGSKMFEKNFGEKVSNKVLELSPIYEFIDKKNAYGTSVTSLRDKYHNGIKIGRFNRITTTLYVLIKNRLLKVNFYSYANDLKDMDNSVIKAEKWLDGLFSINNQNLNPSKGKSLELFSKSEIGKNLIYKFTRDFSALLNKDTPYSIDSETNMLSINSVSDNLVYRYEVKANKNQIDLTNFRKILSGQLVNQYCQTEEFGLLRNLGISFIHRYEDNNGDLIAEFNVNNSYCN